MKMYDQFSIILISNCVIKKCIYINNIYQDIETLNPIISKIKTGHQEKNKV